jgi:hypothetical protein
MEQPIPIQISLSTQYTQLNVLLSTHPPPCKGDRWGLVVSQGLRFEVSEVSEDFKVLWMFEVF